MTLRLTLAISGIFIGCCFAADVDEARLAAATKLTVTIDLEKQLNSGFDAMLPMIGQQAEQMKLVGEDRKELENIYRAWFTEDLDTAALKDELTLLYAEEFTTEELTELEAFYRTPLGKKTLTALPSIMQKSSQMGAVAAQAKQNELLARLKPFLEKHGVK